MTILYWILCLIIGLVPAFFVFRKDRERNIPVKWLPAFFRFLTFFITAALLLAPAFPHHKTIEEKPVVLWLQDQSASMKNALGKDSVRYRKQARALLQAQKKDYRIIPVGFGIRLNEHDIFNYSQQGTDIAGSLEAVMRRYQNQNVGAVILASDGNYNMGGNPVYALSASAVPVYTIGLGDSTHPRDLKIMFTRANKTVTYGNKFELMVAVRAEKLTGQQAKLKIIHNHQTVAEQDFSVSSNFYNSTFRFYLPADKKGLQEYHIVLSPLQGEQNLKNNKKSVFIEVIKRKFTIFIAANAPNPDIAAIKAALKNNPEYNITLKYGSAIPAAIPHVDLLITHNLPSRQGIQIPKHGNIPMWNIIGGHTDLNAFSKEQNLLKIKPRGGLTNVLPAVNTNFNYFLLPKDIREVNAVLPPLKCPSFQAEQNDGAILLYQRQRKNAPLWVIKVGNHPQAVLLGTGIWRWRLYAFRFFGNSGTVDNLIQQTVTLLSHQNNKKAFQVSLPKYQFGDRAPITFSATLKNAAGGLTNMPDVQLSLKDSTGKTTDYNFNKAGKSYQLTINNLPAGKYSYSGKVTFDNKTLSDKGFFAVKDIPLEQMKNYSDYRLLYKLAANTHGKCYTLKNMTNLDRDLKNDKRLKPVLREETHYYQWIDLKWLFFLILLSATIEWLLRKYWGL